MRLRRTGIAAWRREQIQGVFVPQGCGKRRADVPLVPQHHQIVVSTKQFGGEGDIVGRGRSKHLLANHPAQSDQQVQFVAKARLLLAHHPPSAPPQRQCPAWFAPGTRCTPITGTGSESTHIADHGPG